MADQAPQVYTRALACGHSTDYHAANGGAGIEWCPICREWTGVIVIRTDERAIP